MALAQQHELSTPVGVAWPHRLCIQLEVMLGQSSIAEATQMLEGLRAVWSSPEQQAILDYTIWQIDPTREFERQRASSALSALYTHTPNIHYRLYYQHLTGQLLPESPTLPELPEFIAQHRKPFEDILDCINRAIPYLYSSTSGGQPALPRDLSTIGSAL